MQKAVSSLFLLFCVATSWQSSSMLGVGMWFWVIIAGGLLVGFCAYIPALEALGAAVASLLATISVIAVLLGLAASTIGGSSNMGEGVGVLLFLFAMIAASGFYVAALQKRKIRSIAERTEEKGEQDL